MTTPFTRRFRVRWSDADANGHLRNTANDARVGLFASMGYDWPRFQSLRLGPVLFREELDYRREAAIAAFDKDRFDHARTDFPLRGAHGSTAVLNAANEEAVAAFRAGRLPFRGAEPVGH